MLALLVLHLLYQQVERLQEAVLGWANEVLRVGRVMQLKSLNLKLREDLIQSHPLLLRCTIKLVASAIVQDAVLARLWRRHYLMLPHVLRSPLLGFLARSRDLGLL